ncbi:hypothetical protein GGI12_002243 [Dipsacomyces acuminosporus]|nr:hypothetical protein GGI12_002243 [Dipsacomyces acuminosporus]
MADSQLHPATYIIIHERSPEMPVLYVSSSVRQALLYEPDELIGHSPVEYMVDTRDTQDFKKEHGSITEDNVIMTNIFLKSKIGRPIYIRSIAFACSNVNFYMATTFPDVTLDQSQRTLSIQRYRCILSENDNDEGSAGSSSSNTNDRRVDMSAVYSMRATYQACFVLGGLNSDDPDSDAGPKIVFSTDSISRILDVDSCDLQGVPFLSLVTMEDNEKAYRYLERVLNSDELVIDRLQLLINPLEESQLRNPRSVSVEFMGMGSDDGVIMLCQLERPRIADRDDNNGYMSLGDIVSSDPDTSDFPEGWSRLGL